MPKSISLPPISTATALVIDGYPTSRSILMSQLRDYGIGRVSQCQRLSEARVKLEHGHYDFVLCEQYFNDESESGQGLLDDLRRGHSLPFSTVFFMVTGHASYAAVADAAESALDGYLLKPFTTTALFDRLHAARLRKAHLKPIFEAIDSQDFATATALCLKRFRERRAYWLYAARIGAELLLRMQRTDEARQLFETIIEAKTLPWAKLGVARAQMEAGHTARALSTLERLTGESTTFADAYDVMGSALLELGRFEEALQTYKLAAELTPGSVARLQKYGMMAYYMNEAAAAAVALAKACIVGADSKMLDPQSLVLLAFVHLEQDDRRGLDRCVADILRLHEKTPGDLRLTRFLSICSTLQLIRGRQFASAVEMVKAQAAEIRTPGFDFEAACNLIGLLSVLATTSIELKESETWVNAIGLRHGSSRSLGGLLAGACALHSPYAEAMRRSPLRVNKMAEAAMSLTLNGDPEGAIKGLVAAGQSTLNAKLIEIAHQMLARHASKIDNPSVLEQSIVLLRAACGGAPRRGSLSNNVPRQAGVVPSGI